MQKSMTFYKKQTIKQTNKQKHRKKRIQRLKHIDPKTYRISNNYFSDLVHV